MKTPLARSVDRDMWRWWESAAIGHLLGSDDDSDDNQKVWHQA
ncbi:hypothetical protein HMPREF9582_01488 [Cutibacterium acnes HL060PA1]|nr:hypothetical protein HMPREF9619_00374 [Cutibacterium acnes HL082PA2]EFT64659.1 hypothetical protein HMPREF9582_01488 [Cutibacterium acnes HL060PA1]EFT75821.1 hypothetical protein HMPREF9599_00645 [Cutibacterium acnes HL050PA2]EGE69022.1 hypothetical protein HMPREF9341_01346 [Cutibacterium acnes HL103PA1]MCW5113402.1 hypothetical protein [Cutibacterium acnes P05]